MPIAVEPGENRAASPTVRAGGGDLPYGTVAAPTRRRRKKQQPPQFVGGPTPGDLSIRNTIGNVPRAVSDIGIPNMQEFNRRLDAAVRAYRAVNGHTPTPGFAYDLVKVGLDERGYRRLLTSARSPKRRHEDAVARISLETGTRFTGQARIGVEEAFSVEGLADVLQKEGFAGRVFGPTSAGVVNRADVARGARDDLPGAILRTPEARSYVQRQGIVSVSDLFFDQIAESIINLPFGAYQLGKSIGLDARDLGSEALRRSGIVGVFGVDLKRRDVTPTRTVELAEQMVESVKNDILHPTENPGYLAMDIFGFLTAGAGTAARVSAGVARAGQTTGTVARAGAFARGVSRRPLPGSFEMGYEGMVADIPLFENAALRILQRPILEARQERLQARHAGAYEARAIPLIGESIDRYFSAEAKVRRRRAVRAQLEWRLDTLPVAELERVRRWQAISKDTIRGALTGELRSVWKGLSATQRVGLEKAALVYSLADPTPLETLRGAHARSLERITSELTQESSPAVRRSLEREAKAHRFHLAALDQAERYVTDPPPKVERFLRKVEEVSEHQARAKQLLTGIDEDAMRTHLLEVAAYMRGEEFVPGEGVRLIPTAHPELKAPAEGEPIVERLQMPSSRDLPLDVEPFYVPFQRELFRPVGQRFAFGRGRGSGRLGISPPEEAPRSLRYRWTGQSFEYGDFRWDVSDLLATEARHVAKLGIQRKEWEDGWSVGRETPQGIPPKYVRAIRDLRTVPDELRHAVDVIEKDKVTRRDAGRISEKTLDGLMQWLYPKVDDVGPDDHVRYVDERWFPDLAGRVDLSQWRAIDRVLSGAMSVPNELGRVLYLFARVAYAVNFLGSASLALIHQGFLAPANFGRAVRSDAIYGERVAGVIRALAGTTRTESLLTETNVVTRGSHALAEFWNLFTDQKWREAAAIYELRRRDLLRDEDSPADLAARLEADDPKTKRMLAEVRDRVGKAMVDFDNLAWPEKAVLRHLFFVYAWVSRSSVWSLHWMAEHPIQHVTLAQAGRDRAEQIERMIGKVPEWFAREGYIPIGRGFVFNPVQFNVASSLVETAYPLASLWKQERYADVFETLSPAMKLFYDTVKAEQAGGSRGSLLRAFGNVFGDSAIGAAANRARGDDDELKPPPVVSGPLEVLDAALRREVSGRDVAVFEADDFWSTWGILIGGSIVPRRVNSVAAASRYWRDLRDTDPEAYINHQERMALAMVDRQEKLLGKTAPKDVRDFVNLIASIELTSERHRDTSGQDESTGPRDRLLITIRVMAHRGLITKANANAFIKESNSTRGGPALNALRVRILRENGGKAWWQWSAEVKEVAAYASPEFTETLRLMREAGLGSFPGAETAPRDVRREYGRRVVEFLDKYAQARELGDAAVAAFEASASQPVKINGVEFPAIPRVLFAEQTGRTQQDQLVGALRGAWSDATAVEKELLGRPTSPQVQAGWAAYQEVIDRHLAANPGDRISAYQRRELAKQINRDQRYQGFLTDFDFSERSRLRRFESTVLYQRSKHRKQWGEVLAVARQAERYIEQIRSKELTGYTITAVREHWKTYVRERVMPWVEQQGGGFAAEVEALGPTFIPGLLER